ncbi:MAG: hypothetical protein V4543_05790 [Bacteroidota bacterium]
MFINPADWKSETSIFSFLIANIQDEGKLKDSSIDLPGTPEDELNGKKLKFAPGLFDALFSGGEDDIDVKIHALAELLNRVARFGDQECEMEFYNRITGRDGIINIIDPLLDEIGKMGIPLQPYLMPYITDLAFKSAHRNAVKFGMAVLGRSGNRKALDGIKILGLHEEFTVFATLAIISLSNDVVNDLWELAKKTDGWGKIQLVDRLAKMEINEEIKDWLIYEGYKNNIMYDYLAYTCAVQGELSKKLRADTINPALFQSAVEIIECLIPINGPAEDISDLADAAYMLERFLLHAKTHALTARHFVILGIIQEYLVELQNNIPEPSQGFTEDMITDCLIDIAEMLGNKQWPPRILVSLETGPVSEFYYAVTAANTLQINTWKFAWQRLQADHKQGCYLLWSYVTCDANEAQIKAVAEYAMQVIPYKELATGPDNDMGFGPVLAHFQPLGYILPALALYPTLGEPMLLAALNGPVTRYRNSALNVLKNWGKDNWSEAVKKQLLQLKKTEPNENTLKVVMEMLGA